MCLPLPADSDSSKHSWIEDNKQDETMKEFIYRKHKKRIYEDESDLKYGLKQSLVAKKKVDCCHLLT